MQKMLRGLYRKTLYPLAKRVDRLLTHGLCSVVNKCVPGTNSFRLLGVPASSGGYSTFPYHSIYPRQILQRKLPQTVCHFVPPCFRPEVDRVTDAGVVVELHNGISTKNGANLTAEGILIEELSEQFDLPENKLFKLRFNRLHPQISYFDEDIVTLTVDRSRNYFHWMFDVLPRLHLVDKAGLQSMKIYAETDLAFQRETLQLLGFPYEMVISTCFHPYLSAKRLIVPSFPCYRGPAPAWAVQFIRDAFLAPEGSTAKRKRLYVARDDAMRRRIMNREEIEVLLYEYGFEKVTLEGLTFHEQKTLFEEAEAVISPHGAGLTNLVFCRPGTKVVELFAPRFFFHTYWSLANAVGLDYYYLIGEDKFELQSDQPLYDDVEINIDKLRETLRLAQIR